jgi:hypothetical protein
MRRSHLLPALAALALLGCDATGGPQGGQPLLEDPCAATDGGHTWSDLYTCYFGPSGKASCSALSACHGNFPQGSGGTLNGAVTSGYVCGSTKQECWYGMTHAYDAGEADDGGPDAVADAGDGATMTALDAGDAAPDASDGGTGKTDAGDAGANTGGDAAVDPCQCPMNARFCANVPAGCTDPTRTTLWSAIQKPGAMGTGTRNNMPCAASQVAQACPPNAAAYAFTTDDLARISAWIKEGAQDN